MKQLKLESDIFIIIKLNDCYILNNNGKKICCYNLTKSKKSLEYTLEKHEFRVTDLILYSNNTKLISSSNDKICILWDL